MRRRLSHWLIVASFTGAAGCATSEEVPDQGPSAERPDTGVSPDASVDASGSGKKDATVDSAANDAGVDATVVDAAADTATDSPVEATADARADAADASDAASDAPRDAGPDVIVSDACVPQGCTARCGTVNDCGSILSCGACSPLFAAHGALASTGNTVVLEGSFASTGTATVNFPGGVSAVGTVLGTQRISALVPATASEGPISVTLGANTSSPLPFRRASGGLALQRFDGRYPQTDFGRQTPALTVARTEAATSSVAPYLYVFGGGDGSNAPLASIERTIMNADSTLSPFTNLSTQTSPISLSTARAAAASAVIGNYVYVFGGRGNSGMLNTVERALIGSNGAIGTFAAVSGVNLVTARSRHTVEVIGSYVYVFGGNGGSPLATVERAPITAADGTIGTFTTVAGVTLAAARDRHTSVVAEGYLYVIGGHNGSAAIGSVERATILGDGTLSAFSSVATPLSNARYGYSSVVLGSDLYVLNGHDGSAYVTSIEKATFGAGGTLGAFSTVPNIAPARARQGAAAIVVGNNLHVVGGADVTGNVAAIEFAGINGTGDIGPWVQTTTGGPNREGVPILTLGNSAYMIGGYDGPAGVATTSVLVSTLRADKSPTAFTTTGVATATPRFHACAAVIGNYFYLVGGDDGNTGIDTTERAVIQPDGTLGPFQLVANVRLGTQRWTQCVVTGNYLYALGGFDRFSSQTRVDRATIAPDGSISTFTQDVTATLDTSIDIASTFIAGNSLYVIGGRTGIAINLYGSINTTRRAAIASDGSLGAFTAMPALSMRIARQNHTTSLVGPYLYAIGGFGYDVTDAGSSLNNPRVIERAPVNPDGTLGAWTIHTSTLFRGRRGHATLGYGNNLFQIGATPNTEISDLR